MLPLRLLEASPDLRDVLLRLRSLLTMQHSGQVDVRAPRLPGTEMLFPEVDLQRVGGGDTRMISRFRTNRKDSLT